MTLVIDDTQETEELVATAIWSEGHFEVYSVFKDFALFGVRRIKKVQYILSKIILFIMTYKETDYIMYLMVTMKYYLYTLFNYIFIISVTK